MEKTKFIFVYILNILFLVGCAVGNCRSQKIKDEQAGPAGVVKDNKLIPEPNSADRVKVFKHDGSVQCQTNKGLSADEMAARDLSGIKIYKTFKSHDQKLRSQVCGSPTGNVNVLEIDKRNLSLALEKGYSEWVF